MKTHHTGTVITAMALLLCMTGCTGMGGGQSGSISGPSTSSVKTTATTPENTPDTQAPARGADPVRIRDGIYLDTWGENVATHFQAAANVYLHENKNKIAPGDLQKYLDRIIPTDTPDAFKVEANTTASNNFTIKVWHDNGYVHFDENTAYVAESDPAVTPTPSPTSTGLESNGSQRLDEETKKLLIEAAVAAREYRQENQGMLPTDNYMRTNGFIPQGWEWSISTNVSYPEYFLIRVWNPDAVLFNSKRTAASFSSFPQPELRPAHNFDADPFIPNIGFLSPPATAPTSTPTQSGGTDL